MYMHINVTLFLHIYWRKNYKLGPMLSWVLICIVSTHSYANSGLFHRTGLRAAMK